MNNVMINRKLNMLVLILVLCSSCALQSVYDQHAYEQAISLKVKSLALMDLAKKGDATANKAQIDALTTDLEILYEYESRRKNNDESIKMVWLIKSPDKNLLGGFIKRWKSSEGNMSDYFVDQAKDQIEEAFNLLIGLESGKIKTNNEKVQSLIKS